MEAAQLLIISPPVKSLLYVHLQDMKTSHDEVFCKTKLSRPRALK